MYYQIVETKRYADPPVLVLTKAEAKCAETLTNLVVGDKVVIIYVAEVAVLPASPSNYPLSVVLDQPIIVKKPAFNAFVERLMDFLADTPQTVQTQGVSGSMPFPAPIGTLVPVAP
jgi:hypothetical protein